MGAAGPAAAWQAVGLAARRAATAACAASAGRVWQARSSSAKWALLASSPSLVLRPQRGCFQCQRGHPLSGIKSFSSPALPDALFYIYVSLAVPRTQPVFVQQRFQLEALLCIQSVCLAAFFSLVLLGSNVGAGAQLV